MKWYQACAFCPYEDREHAWDCRWKAFTVGLYWDEPVPMLWPTYGTAVWTAAAAELFFRSGRSKHP